MFRIGKARSVYKRLRALGTSERDIKFIICSSFGFAWSEFERLIAPVNGVMHGNWQDLEPMHP